MVETLRSRTDYFRDLDPQPRSIRTQVTASHNGEQRGSKIVHDAPPHRTRRGALVGLASATILLLTTSQRAPGGNRRMMETISANSE
jgi:hypothetical protein